MSVIVIDKYLVQSHLIFMIDDSKEKCIVFPRSEKNWESTCFVTTCGDWENI